MSETIVNWDFSPFMPARADCPGEVIYTQYWQDSMGGIKQEIEEYFLHNHRNDHPIIAVMDCRGYSYPDARAVRVASSVIRWLGTHMGQSFLRECESETALRRNYHTSRQDAYLAAWAIWNNPNNNSSRQHIMGTEKMTYEDYQNMDKTILWLGTDEGQKFIKTCQAKLGWFEPGQPQKTNQPTTPPHQATP